MTFHNRVEQYISIYLQHVLHITLSLFNHTGYTLMINEHILCWGGKKKHTILYTGQ